MRGFVFGKFYPLHKGHLALIDFSLKHCTELIVMVCASSRENIPVDIRVNWVKDCYSGNKKVNVVPFEYDESLLPNTSISSREVSKVWSQVFLKALPKLDILFTSEPYGNFVAEYMGIQHLMYDEHRKLVNVSGTGIRNSILECWGDLPDTVKSYFQKTVILLGTESVGKSTLATRLAKKYDAVLVTEVGRDIIPDSQSITPHQLHLVAKAHSKNISAAKRQLAPLVIVDTDVHITQSYAKYKFGNYLELPEEIYQANKGDLYLYLTMDVPFIQDGTRLDVNQRTELDSNHQSTLKHFGISYHELKGDYQSKEDQAGKLIEDMFMDFQ